ncbi:hypothetical protein RCL1_001860 [Eukaryota sp. TZLM3-RCL]
MLSLSATQLNFIKYFLSHDAYLVCSSVSCFFRSVFIFTELPHQNTLYFTPLTQRTPRSNKITHVKLTGIAQRVPISSLPNLIHISLEYCPFQSAFINTTRECSDLYSLSSSYSFLIPPVSTLYTSLRFLCLRGATLSRQFCSTLGPCLVNLKSLDLSFCQIQDVQTLAAFFSKNCSTPNSPFVFVNFFGMTINSDHLKFAASHLVATLERLYCMYIIAPSLGFLSNLIENSRVFLKKWTKPVINCTDFDLFCISFSSINSLLTTLFISSRCCPPSFLPSQHPFSLVFGFNPFKKDEVRRSDLIVEILKKSSCFYRYQSIDPLVFDLSTFDLIDSVLYAKIVDLIAFNLNKSNFVPFISKFCANISLLSDVLSNSAFKVLLSFSFLKNFFISQVFPNDLHNLFRLFLSSSAQLQRSNALLLEVAKFSAPKCQQELLDWYL